MNKFLTCFLLLMSFSLWAEPEPVDFWHSFAGQLGAELNQQIKRFNQMQSEVRIKPQYKGDYIEALSSYAAARHAGKAPALIQVFEVGTALMQQTPGLIEPVGHLMADFAYPDPGNRLLPAIASFYQQEQVLQALPLNVSLPVMYYNRDQLQTLGVNAQNFPETWEGFEKLMLQLRQMGYECAYTTAYPAWIHVEVFAAMHQLQFVSLIKGSYRIAGQPALEAHWQRLASWQQQGLFAYGGRNSDATILFTSGRCPLFSQSSGSMASLASMVPFQLGVAALPYDAKWADSPVGSAFGGGAIWVTAGQPLRVRKGAARFLHFLSEPRQQRRWHRRTGYLPMGDRGFYQDLLQEKGTSPVLKLAWSAFKEPGPIPDRLPQNQIRTVLEQNLEAVFCGQLGVQAALARAQRTIHYRLRRFHSNIVTK